MKSYSVVEVIKLNGIEFIKTILQALIRNCGISIEELSSNSMVDKATIYSILKDDDADPTIEVLSNLCAALNTNLAEFFKA